MYDIVIKNGRIVDGTGNPWYRADVGIQDGRIAEISRRGLAGGRRVIDATGLVVSPGFCDLHTHSDSTILWHPRAMSTLRQGVTTEGVGQCGISDYAFTESYRPVVKERQAEQSRRMPDEIDVDWTTLGEWRARVERQGLGINLAPYCGHGTVRDSVMGPDGQGGERYHPTAEEMAAMKALVRQAMEDGAFGLSTGLRYPWGRNSLTEEVIELAKVAAEYGGVYISHMRSEEDALIEAVQELIRICDEAGLRGSMTHHKALLPENFGKPSETIRLLDRARARGVDVICDLYPWTHAAEINLGTNLLPYLITPDLTLEEIKYKLANLVQEIQDPQTWQALKRRAQESWEKELANNEKRQREMAALGVRAPNLWHPASFYYIVHSPSHPELIGKNLQEAAVAMGAADYLDGARDLYVADGGRTFVACGVISEDDIITILTHPFSAISTDGAAYDEPASMDDPLAWSHPRNYGTYAKVLQHYVRERGLLRLEEAVRKMTSLPLGFLGIKDRGLIREGMWADITLFDPDRITNKATFAQPGVYPEGIPYVLVNGQVAIDQGQHTGVLAGRVLRRE